MASLFVLLASDQDRWHTLFKLLCQQLCVSSLCVFLRKTISQRWSGVSWIIAAIATFEIGLTRYFEVILFNTSTLGTFVTVLFTTSVFNFLVDSTINTGFNGERLTFEDHNCGDHDGNNFEKIRSLETNRTLQCLKKRLLEFVSRVFTTLLSLPLLQYLSIVALSPEFHPDELSCLASCESGIGSLPFWTSSVLEIVCTFAIEWCFVRSNLLEGVSRNSVKGLVKMVVTSLLFFFGLPLVNLHLDPFTAFLFVYGCDSSDVVNHLLMHSLCPLLGLMAVCLWPDHSASEKYGSERSWSQKNESFSNVNNYCYQERRQDFHNCPRTLLANNNSKQNHLTKSSKECRRRKNSYTSGSSEPLTDEEEGCCRKNNAARNNMSKFSRKAHHTMGKSSIDSYRFEHPKSCHRDANATLRRRFSDTSVASGRKKYCGNCNRCFNKKNQNSVTSGRVVNGRKLKSPSELSLSRHDHDHHCRSNHTIESTSDASYDSILDNMLKNKDNSTYAKNNPRCRRDKYSDIVQPRTTGRKASGYVGCHSKHCVYNFDEAYQGVKVNHQHGDELKALKANWCNLHRRVVSPSRDDGNVSMRRKKENDRRISSKENVPDRMEKFSSHVCHANKHHNCSKSPDSLYAEQNYNRQVHNDRNKKKSVRNLKNFEERSEGSCRPYTTEYDKDHKCRHRHSKKALVLEGHVDKEADRTEHFSMPHDKMFHRNINPYNMLPLHDQKCFRHRCCCDASIRKGSATSTKHTADTDFRLSGNSLNGFSLEERTIHQGKLLKRRCCMQAKDVALGNFQNNVKNHDCCQRPYANKTQNAKDSARPKRSSTPIGSSTTYTVIHSPCNESDCQFDADDNIDQSFRRGCRRNAGNFRCSRNISNDENGKWQNETQNFSNCSRGWSSKDEKNETLKQLLTAQENIRSVQRPAPLVQLKRKHCTSDGHCGEMAMLNRQPRNNITRVEQNDFLSKEMNEVSEMSDSPKDHSKLCWRRMRCSRLYDISESDGK